MRLVHNQRTVRSAIGSSCYCAKCANLTVHCAIQIALTLGTIFYLRSHWTLLTLNCPFVHVIDFIILTSFSLSFQEPYGRRSWALNYVTWRKEKRRSTWTAAIAAKGVQRVCKYYAIHSHGGPPFAEVIILQTITDTQWPKRKCARTSSYRGTRVDLWSKIAVDYCSRQKRELKFEKMWSQRLGATIEVWLCALSCFRLNWR